MNPNDPVDNPEAFSSSASYAAPSPNRSGSEHGRAPAIPPPRSPPPAHRNERRPSDAPPAPMSPNPYGGASPHHRNAGAASAGRTGGYSVEQSPSPSPLHPHSVEGSGYGLVANSVDRPNRARATSRGNGTVSMCSALLWCSQGYLA